MTRFNGAATFRLRKAKGPDEVVLPDPASMGPQPFGCGRRRHGRPAPSREYSFNGAATFRLRKDFEASNPVLKFAPLQWGRNLSVAEGPRPAEKVELDTRASMGPQPFGCGRASLPPRTQDPMALQWGRNLSVAEGYAYRKVILSKMRASMGPQPFGCGRIAWNPIQRIPVPCFNGAATFRLRKVYVPQDIRIVQYRFNGAATFRLRKDPCFCPVICGSFTLQWGRNLSVAEGVG